jgi:zinc/manganese transport system substrate-binding protein
MKHLLCIVLFAWAGIAQATIKVVTSLPDLADFTRQVGGDRVTVDNIVRGDQNPHFVEVKPSYMMKLKAADLFFMVGMDLEMWAPQIIDGSRNTKLEVVDLSKRIDKLEIPAKLDASQGDVHRYGNPHYWLDPRNIRIVIEDIVAALARVSPGDEQFFRANGEAYLKKLDGKIAQWSAAMKPFAGTKIITFHKSWTYFTRWLGLTVTDQVEPKPGIVPSPSHTAELIALIRQAGIKVIVVEPFYDSSAADQIARATGARVLRLSTSTGGVDGTSDYLMLMDYNITTLAGALK